MERRPISMEDLGRLIIDIAKRNSPTPSPSLIGDDTDANVLDFFDNPMTGYGSLIEGDEGGSAVDLPIGLEGQVLTVTLEAGELRARWQDAPSGSGQYRSNVYATYGGGYFLFDSAGDAIYVLRDLE